MAELIQLSNALEARARNEAGHTFGNDVNALVQAAVTYYLDTQDGLRQLAQYLRHEVAVDAAPEGRNVVLLPALIQAVTQQEMPTTAGDNPPTPDANLGQPMTSSAAPSLSEDAQAANSIAGAALSGAFAQQAPLPAAGGDAPPSEADPGQAWTSQAATIPSADAQAATSVPESGIIGSAIIQAFVATMVDADLRGRPTEATVAQIIAGSDDLAAQITTAAASFARIAAQVTQIRAQLGAE